MKRVLFSICLILISARLPNDRQVQFYNRAAAHLAITLIATDRAYGRLYKAANEYGAEVNQAGIMVSVDEPNPNVESDELKEAVKAFREAAEALADAAKNFEKNVRYLP